MFLKVLECPDLLFEIIIHCNYPTIKELCLANRKISQLCKTNISIKDCIRQKKKEYIKFMTDELIESQSVSDYMNQMRVYNRMFAAFCVSIKKGDIEIVSELIRRGVDPCDNADCAMVVACSAGSLKMVQFLQSKGVDLHNPRRLGEAIATASKYGYFDIFKYILQHTSLEQNINIMYSCLDQAGRHDHDEIANYILQHHHHQFASNWWLIDACKFGKFGIVKSILHYPDVKSSYDPMQACNLAIEWGHLDIAQYILQHQLVN